MFDTVQLSPMSLVPELLDAAQTYDTRRMLALLDRSRSAFGLAATVDEVLLPSMRLVGRLWENGRVDVSEEHLATAAAQMWLAQVQVAADAPSRPGTVLLACGPRDRHTLGLDCLAALLTERGVDCRSLGSATPTPALRAALERIRPVAVVVVSHSLAGRPGAVRSIESVAQLGPDVYYAGGAFLDPANRDGLPGRYLGLTLAVAADVVVAHSLGQQPQLP